MLYITPKPNQVNRYPVAVLIKETALKESDMIAYYLNPLKALGVNAEDVIFIGLLYNEQNKAPVKLIKPHIQEILANCTTIGVKTLLVADGNYFKRLTKLSKSEPHHGYIKPCAIPSFEYIDVILSVNYQALFYNPIVQDRLNMSLKTLANHNKGTHIDLGKDVIHSSVYPSTLLQISTYLEKLKSYTHLTCDIETFSLAINTAGIGTIAFAWDKHNGIAFSVEMHTLKKEIPYILNMLRDFFITYTGKLIFHNGTFDIKMIIYKLFMDNDLDTKGLLYGLNIMYRNVDCTKIITYLATNTTAGNKLSLKHNAFEYTGNYAQDNIDDIRKIPLDTLLEYNLVDALATWYTRDKYYPTMVSDNQVDIYKNIMRPSMKVITHMELIGMPMDGKTINITWDRLNKVHDGLQSELRKIPVIMDFVLQQQKEAMLKANLLLKTKVKTLEEFKDPYNPGSPKQTAALLFEYIGFDVEDLTATKLPATGAKTIKKLSNNIDHTFPQHKRLLEILVEIAEVSIIINTFLKAFKDKTILKFDGCYYLHGNFNIGGTLSGRLSSSKINLQNLPSTGSTYAKDIKNCFVAPPGWIMVGADFSSLEDKISALQTKDPNKLKVYTDGYDGHCLRAFTYFPEKCKGIVNTVESINSIKDKFTDVRQYSKGPTFCLTYQGTWKALMGLGFTKSVSMQIESNYHDLYKVSDDWVQNKIIEASKVGYTTVAFGLRLRTPILGQTIINTRATPYEAQQEGRTMGNALGQSYGMLNNRAAIELHNKLLDSPYAEDIKPIAHIHDAQYFIIKDDLNVIKWLNDNLIKAMEWQDIPELKHDVVKLGGELTIFYPTWADAINLPNYCSKQEIYNVVHKSIDNRKTA